MDRQFWRTSKAWRRHWCNVDMRTDKSRFLACLLPCSLSIQLPVRMAQNVAGNGQRCQLRHAAFLLPLGYFLKANSSVLQATWQPRNRNRAIECRRPKQNAVINDDRDANQTSLLTARQHRDVHCEQCTHMSDPCCDSNANQQCQRTIDMDRGVHLDLRNGDGSNGPWR